MTRETDPAVTKKLAEHDRLIEQLLQRVEDLERAGSPDGIAQQADDRQQHVAQFCQHVRRMHGDTQTDLIGG